MRSLRILIVHKAPEGTCVVKQSIRNFLLRGVAGSRSNLVTGYSRISAGRMMTLAPRVALLAVSLLLLCSASDAQAQNALPSPTASPSPTSTPAPSAVPLPDIVSASDSASEGLNEIQSEVSSNKTVDNVTRELAATTKEIDARELETRRILRPGVPLETLGDFATWAISRRAGKR